MWQVLVDWDLQARRPYVIIDPFDPSGLMYFSESEYVVQQRTLGSMNAPFIVIARPGSSKPEPIKTPPCEGERNPFSSGIDPVTWRKLKDLRSFMTRNVLWGKADTVKVNDGNIMGLIEAWSRELFHYLDVKSPAKRVEQILPFAKHLQDLIRHNGIDFTIARLKVMLFALYSYVGGNPLSSTAELGHQIKLQGGLPKVFSAPMRQSIRTGSLNRVRFWASILNMYKYIEGNHKLPDLGSIRAPAYQGVTTDFRIFCQSFDGFYSRMYESLGYTPNFRYESRAGLLITSAGANCSNSMASIPYDAVAWSKQPVNHPMEWFTYWKDDKMQGFMKKAMSAGSAFDWVAKDLLEKVVLDDSTLLSGFYLPEDPRDYQGFWKNMERIFPHSTDAQLAHAFWYGQREEVLKLLPAAGLAAFRNLLLRSNVKNKWLEGVDDYGLALQLWRRKQTGGWPTRIQTDGIHCVGRLHAIPEPAGKVRVVAICDYFSQVALKPVHDFLFDILRALPTDATFDQEGAVKAFADRGYKDIYSYDLKSATDLIPKELYLEVMEPLLGPKGTSLWMNLLADRDFFVKPKDFYGRVEIEPHERYVRYTRGQPMGAYSSWGGLALVHHALVQYAAALAGHKGWFTAYVVLGDDITIADAACAEKYLYLCKRYGITVGLAKSLVSNKGLMNFASQTLIDGKNISPISLREDLGSQNLDRRIEFASRIRRRWYEGTETDPRSITALRQILTAPQWLAIEPELRGVRPSMLLRGILFCLRNPFISEGIHIGKIAEWLGMLVPELSTLPSSTLQELDLVLRTALWRFVVRNTRVRREKAIQYIEYAKSLLSGANGVRGNSVFFAYLGHKVVNDTVYDNIYTPLQEVELWIREQVAVLDCEVPRLRPQAEEPVDLDSAKRLPTLEELIKQWEKLSRIPRISLPKKFGATYVWHLFDSLKGIQEDMDRAKTPKWGKRGATSGNRRTPKSMLVKESLRAPLGEILLTFARVLGCKIPVHSLSLNLPHRLWKALSLTLDWTMYRWVVRDASPCMMPDREISNSSDLVSPLETPPGIETKPLPHDEGDVLPLMEGTPSR